MKALKWMSIAFMSAMLCFGLSACSNNDDVTTPEDTPAKEYMVSIGFKGEITISEAPLGRASGNDLYGIQVYSCPSSDKTSYYKEYAYGLFDDLSAMNIKLTDGYKYKFIATMIENGKEKLVPYLKGYGEPFAIDLNNEFIYSNDEELYLGGGYTETKTGDFYRPILNRYYGEYSEYTPEENGNITINMLRTVFGLKVVANKLSEGTLTISMEKAPEMKITNPQTEIENIFTFLYVEKAYSTNNYSETISTSFKWTKSDGAVIPLGNYDLTFKRNKQTIVTIEISDASQENTLNLSLESSSMTEGDKYTIEDKEITNNTVTPGTSE